MQAISRKEKIDALKAISEGKIAASSLSGPQSHLFLQTNYEPELFSYRNRIVTRAEMESICKAANKGDSIVSLEMDKRFGKEAFQNLDN